MTDDEQPTARIMPFPAVRAEATATKPAPAETPQERLTRAVARLNAALAEQRTAAQALKTVVGDLRGAMANLGRSLEGYSGQLAEVAARTGALRQQAVQLGEIADASIPPDAKLPPQLH